MEKLKEKQDMQIEILFTPEDIAEAFNVDVSTVESWVNNKFLSAIFVTPRNDMLFSLDNILKFIKIKEQRWLLNFWFGNEVGKERVVKNGWCSD